MSSGNSRAKLLDIAASAIAYADSTLSVANSVVRPPIKSIKWNWRAVTIFAATYHHLLHEAPDRDLQSHVTSLALLAIDAGDKWRPAGGHPDAIGDFLASRLIEYLNIVVNDEENAMWSVAIYFLTCCTTSRVEVSLEDMHPPDDMLADLSDLLTPHGRKVRDQIAGKDLLRTPNDSEYIATAATVIGAHWQSVVRVVLNSTSGQRGQSR